MLVNVLNPEAAAEEEEAEIIVTVSIEEGKSATNATDLDILPVNARKNPRGVTGVTEKATLLKIALKVLMNLLATIAINPVILLALVRKAETRLVHRVCVTIVTRKGIYRGNALKTKKHVTYVANPAI